MTRVTKITDELEQEVISLYQSGLSSSMICDKINKVIGVTAILSILRKNNIETRRCRKDTDKVNWVRMLKPDKLAYTEQVIEMYKSGLSMKKIAETIPNFNANDVFNILHLNNIETRSRGGKKKVTDEDIIELYNSGKSSSEIGKNLNMTGFAIISRLKNCNVSRDNIYHNIDLIRNYWSVIDSYDKAYFLGFLLTDGNVIGTAIRISLKSKDREILEVFKKYTNNDNPVKDIVRKRTNFKEKYYYESIFSLRCKEWVSDLSKYGMTENKTFTIKFIDFEDDYIMSNFIRGLIDGDGFATQDGRLGFCGTLDMVNDFQKFLHKRLGTTLHNLKLYTTITHITYGRKDSLLIGKYIYEHKHDCYLKRKYERFELLYNKYANTEINL